MGGAAGLGAGLEARQAVDQLHDAVAEGGGGGGRGVLGVLLVEARDLIHGGGGKQLCGDREMACWLVGARHVTLLDGALGFLRVVKW